jgi:hypothetical protein
MEKDQTEVIVDQEEDQTEVIVDQEEDQTEVIVDQVQPKKRSALEHFYARMRLPIGTSSISFPISEDARKDIEKYKLEIEERHRNGMY